ncbi:MAG: beta-ketoacyl-ACP synthase III [Bacillota bacterium]|jgi:3-oxoacyl-[acyl-carrier-protein] synthase-3
MNFKIIGIGSYVPPLTIDNHQLSQLVDTTDEWISTRTGIRARHVVNEESVTDLAVKSAKAALSDANIKADELDLIICSTLQGDYLTPALACIVQGEIGATCPGFDINAACPGFVYGLDVASAYISSGQAAKVLFICAETLSRHVDWQDRATCVIFGDAAGAVVLTAGESLLARRLTCTSNKDVLNSKAPQGNCPFSLKEEGGFVYMNGQEVYKFAVSSVGEDFEFLTKEINLTADDIDYFILHQANKRIVEAIRHRLKQPVEKFPTNIENYGNTSSASIPVLLDELDKAGKLKKGQLLFISAFGSGLSTGSYILKWDK